MFNLEVHSEALPVVAMDAKLFGWVSPWHQFEGLLKVNSNFRNQLQPSVLEWEG